MRDHFDELGSRGVAVIGVSTEAPARARRYLAEHPLPFPLALDPTRRTVKAYRVYNPMNIDAFRIAHPSSFVIDGAGIVRACSVGRNQFDLPPLAWYLSALDSMARE